MKGLISAISTSLTGGMLTGLPPAADWPRRSLQCASLQRGYYSYARFKRRGYHRGYRLRPDLSLDKFEDFFRRIDVVPDLDDADADVLPMRNLMAQIHNAIDRVFSSVDR